MENVEIVSKEKQLEFQRKYMKAWRSKNKDRLKGYQQKWLSKQALKMAAEQTIIKENEKHMDVE